MPYSIYKGTLNVLHNFISINLNSYTSINIPETFEDIFKNTVFLLMNTSSNNLLNKNLSEYENFNDASTKLESMLSNAVSDQLISDVPIGAFLSGGIDSSLITALMQKESMNKIQTFTIGFQDKRYDESGYARDVSKYLGTDHTELILSENDILNIIPNLSKIYSDLLQTLLKSQHY